MGKLLRWGPGTGLPFPAMVTQSTSGHKQAALKNLRNKMYQLVSTKEESVWIPVMI